MPDVAFSSSADVLPLLHLPNITISTYGDADVALVKEMLPKNLGLSWKKFGISKVHEMLLETSHSNIVLWKMMSSDPQFSKALFVTNARKRVLGKQKEVNDQQPKVTVDTKVVLEPLFTQEESSEDSDAESSRDSDEESEEEEVTDFVSEAAVATNFKHLPDISSVPMDFEDVAINSWVAVCYSGEFYLGRVLRKTAGEYLVRYLTQPYGTRTTQELEKDAVFYQEVFQAPIQPWKTDIDNQGKRTRKTVFKY